MINVNTYVIKNALEMLNKGLEEEFVKLMRGFAATDNFLSKFRMKPCAAILDQIIKRTRTYTEKNHSDKISFPK